MTGARVIDTGQVSGGLPGSTHRWLPGSRHRCLPSSTHRCEERRFE